MLRAESAFLRSGKVRDLYRIDDERLLLVASDRISAFDVVLPTPIPDKGRVLTGLSRFWFRELAGVVPNHLLATAPWELPARLLAEDGVAEELRGRMMIGRFAEVLPIECVVRGYLAGSGWAEYRTTGEVCGVGLPSGLRESDRLPEPIYTPAWKAPQGQHDENIPFATGRVPDRPRAGGQGPRRQPRAVPPRRRGVRARGHHPRRHQVRVRRPAVGRGDPDRRGPDARTRRASGTPPTTSPAGPRRASTSSSSATGSRPSHGTVRHPARRCRRTSSRAPASAT